MPTAIAEITLAISYTRQVVFIPLDDQWLSAITLFNIAEDSSPTQTWASLILTQNTPLWTNTIAVLAQGYLGGNASLAWTGKIIADPNTQISAHIFGTINTQFRLLAVVNKVIRDKEGLILAES